MSRHWAVAVLLVCSSLAAAGPAAGEGPAADASAVISDAFGSSEGRLDSALVGTAGGFRGVLVVQDNRGASSVLDARTSLVEVIGAGPGRPATARARTGPVASTGNTVDVPTGTRSTAVTESFDEGVTPPPPPGNPGAGIDPDRAVDILTTAFGGRLRENGAGMVSVQQNTGDANALGSAMAVVGIVSPAATSLTQDAITTVLSRGNTGPDGGPIAVPASQTRINLVDGGSFTEQQGVALLQQSSGDANALGAAISVAGSAEFAEANLVGPAEQTSDTAVAVGGGETRTRARDAGSRRFNLVEDSFQRMGGVALIQQTTGTANALGTAVAVAGDAPPVGPAQDPPAPPADIGTTDNSTVATARVTEVATESLGGQRRNAVTREAFHRSAGIAHVQQLDGDANAVAAASGAIGVTGAVDRENTSGTGLAQAGDVGAITVTAVDARTAGGAVRRNRAANAFGRYRGFAELQQVAGDANAVYAATAAIEADAVGGREVLAPARVGRMELREVTVRAGSSTRSNVITDGFAADAAGRALTQQITGNANAVTAAATAVYGAADRRIEGAVNALENAVADVRTRRGAADVRRNRVDGGSFGASAGMLGVQQIAGDANIAATGTALTPVMGTAVVRTRLAGTVTGTRHLREPAAAAAESVNILRAALGDFRGVTHVQQNTGDGNLIQSGISAAASLGTAGIPPRALPGGPG